MCATFHFGVTRLATQLGDCITTILSTVDKNAQTVVPAGAASEMLHTVPLQTVRGLGGKLGEAVVSWSKADTASDLKVLTGLRRIFQPLSGRDYCGFPNYRA